MNANNINKTRFTNCKCHYNCETQVWICNTCENIKDENYRKLVDFLKKEIELREHVCATNHAVLLDNAKQLLKEIGEI